jgi:hypothetical protein
VKHSYVGLAAIDARVGEQVVPDPLLALAFEKRARQHVRSFGWPRRMGRTSRAASSLHIWCRSSPASTARTANVGEMGPSYCCDNRVTTP